MPQTNGEIRHEFYANDNARHQINYVNEFTGKSWVAPVKDNSTTANSPRSIEIVDNAKAKSGKAVLVSLENGYGEFDTTDGTKLVGVTGSSNITGACRLPNGNTALGNNTVIKIVSPTGAQVSSITLPIGDNLRTIIRDAETGHYWFTKTKDVYEINDQGTVLWKGNLGGTDTKGYAAYPRPGGGAYATNGEPAEALELDKDGVVLTRVGGQSKFSYLSFSSGFAHLANGNFVVTNWLGHETAPAQDTPEILEFTPANKNRLAMGQSNLGGPGDQRLRDPIARVSRLAR